MVEAPPAPVALSSLVVVCERCVAERDTAIC
jgi:hypothetical protein